MTYLLDTNAAIALLKENPQLLHHVRRVGTDSLKLCAPVEAELWFGVAKSAARTKSRPFAYLIGMDTKLTLFGPSNTALWRNSGLFG